MSDPKPGGAEEGGSDSDDSIPSNLSFEFTADNCQKRIDEFVEITQTDSALAQFFLQDRKWNVLRSVNDYFQEVPASESNKKREFEAKKDTSSQDDKQEEDQHGIASKKSKTTDEPSSSRGESTGGSTSTESGEPNLFRHISWNIDGMNEKNLKLRVEAVCSIIIKEKASFVFLQEVTPECERIVRQKLCEKFDIFSGNNFEEANYYTMTLVEKQPFIKVQNNEIVDFRASIMGRNLLKTNVSCNDAKICLLNTHLESTKDGTAFRIQQLNFMLRHIKEISPDVTVLAGGDLNLRDKELAEIGGLPPNVEDAWEATGRRKEVQFTWDMMRNDNLPYYDPGSKSSFKPRMRFDRIFVRKTFPVRIELIHFGLIGIERLKPYVCFPSDHWGLITSYQIFAKPSA